MEKKYIIDLNPDCVDGEYLRIPARIAGEEQWLVTKAALTPYTEPDMEKAREEAYRQGYDTGYGTKVNEFYEQGLIDAWEAARKIAVSVPLGGMSQLAIKRMFGVEWQYVLMNCTPATVIEKIRQYEQKQEEIHLGDEVTFLPNNAKGIVSECHVPDVYSDNDKYAVWCGGTMEYVLKQHLTKTGRTFPEIAEILQKLLQRAEFGVS